MCHINLIKMILARIIILRFIGEKEREEKRKKTEIYHRTIS